ncbi:unnamed protein product [Aureobasidium pullulans]|nr:unnamed protein product [Aureobasidium pullulans]
MATRMVTRSVEKEGRDSNHQSEGSPTPSDKRGSDTPREITMNDIMQQLLDAQRRAQEKEKREQEREKREQEKEERYREEIRQLQTTVTTLVLDIKSLQEAAPNWGSLQSSSLQTGTTDSYASVAAQGVQLSSQEANRIMAAIRSNEGLDKVVLNQFMIRHTNKDVHLAYFKIDREAERIARAHVDEWLPMFLEGARLIESTWYSIKVDFILKIEATDHQTGAISQETRDAFAEENEVEVKLMRWLGRPKEYTSYASVVAKLATKEQVEKLLQRQADSEEDQDPVITVTNLDTHRRSARTPPGARGAHKKDTTAAN